MIYLGSKPQDLAFGVKWSKKRKKGYYLGAMAFEEGARSGTHQHLDVASSFFVQGALIDYYTVTQKVDLGINLPGATPDAVAYERTIILSRLEGPARYLPEGGAAFCLEPTQRTELRTSHGAFVLIWSEGRMAWMDSSAPDLFGFD